MYSSKTQSIIMNLLKSISLSLLLLTGFSLPVWADIESWTAVDVRIPVQRAKTDIWIPSRLNVFTISQLAPRFEGGLGILRHSLGPQWDFNPNFSFSLLGDIIYLGVPGGKNTQEYRLNLEPVLRGNFLPELSWLERTRLEYRVFPDRAHWRLRSLLRLNWMGVSPDWIPYTTHEIFLEYPQGLNQSRHILGFRHRLDQANQLDIGYMWRWRKGSHGSWDQDHILVLFLFFVPPADALPVTGGE